MAAPALQWVLPEHYVEKRQLFLRSYQFSRKRSAAERLRNPTVRVRRLICARLRSARRIPHLVWTRLTRVVLCNHRRHHDRCFHRLAGQPSRSGYAGFCCT